MGLIQLEDTEDSIVLVAFSKVWQKLKGNLVLGSACAAEGKIDDRGQMVLDRLTNADAFTGKSQRYVNIILNVSEGQDVDVRKLVTALNECRGKARVMLELRSEEETCRMCLSCSASPEKLPDALSGVLSAGSYVVEMAS